MSLISWQFAVFVAVVLSVYYLLQPRQQNIWLLISSYVFYAWLGWQFAVVLAGVTLVTLAIARRIAARPPNRLSWLWLGIALNILCLLVFKYFDFFKPETLAVLALLKITVDAAVLDIIIPIGLSFTILQTISFLIDVYRGQIADLPSPIDFALYVAYFPKLTSGPIERARAFIPQLTSPRRVDNETLARSFSLIMVGLFRKVVIADQIISQIPGFATSFNMKNLTGLTGADRVILVVAYGFYLFNDFAGYSSIVRGVSGLFGIELSQNFLTPYFSRSFTEFWNQWHITLSQWLRDYIYFPLTRYFLRHNMNPRFVLTLVAPPLVTMIVSGLWHGITVPLLIWGVLHGLYLVAERIISAYRPVRRPDQQPPLLQLASGAVIFILVNLAWIPFRATDLGMIRDNFLSLASPGLPLSTLQLLRFLMFGVMLDAFQRARNDELFFRKWSFPAQVACLTAACLLIFIFSFQVAPTFVYQKF